MLKVFYSNKQNVRANSSFSPSAGKPEQVVISWKARNQPFEIVSFEPVTREDLKLVHDEAYVDGVLDLQVSNGFGNKSPEVASALPWVAGSMASAAIYAFKNQTITISPTSGAHHAQFNRGGGFCTFNFLVLAAIKVHALGAKKIGIIDLDCQYGDGTQDIINKLHLNFIQHYTYGGDPLAYKDSTKWLQTLPKIVSSFMDCDFIIYNAGVDSHVDDPLGGYLSTEQIEIRDQLVINPLRKNMIPMAISLAGGYQKNELGNIPKVLELHGLVFNTAWFAEKIHSDS